MSKLAKLSILLQLLVTRPPEFYDRVEVLWQARKQKYFWNRLASAAYSNSICIDDAIGVLSKAVVRDMGAILSEPELQAIQNHVAKLTRSLEQLAILPFPTFFNADSTLAQLCYAVCRAWEPKTVLETGVGYGVTSATILAALHKTQAGTLHSIDLPPIADKDGKYVGLMVPEEYRCRWHFYRGSSKRLLARLLPLKISQVDIFVHDSPCTYELQKFELESVWPHLAPAGVMVLNNVGKNQAFAEFAVEKNITSSFLIEQKEKKGDLTGIILKN